MVRNIALVAAILVVAVGTCWVTIATLGDWGWNLIGAVVGVALLILLPAYTAGLFGASRTIGRNAGFGLGFLLNWIGVAVVLCFPRKPPTKKCPYCAERVRVEALVCKHCRRELKGAGASSVS